MPKKAGRLPAKGNPSRYLDKMRMVIKLMQEINQGIADVNSGRVMSLEDAKNRLL